MYVCVWLFRLHLYICIIYIKVCVREGGGGVVEYGTVEPACDDELTAKSVSLL